MDYSINDSPANIVMEDIATSLIILPKYLYDTLLKENNSGDLIAVYSFYYYTAKWQQTNQIKATNGYCQTGLNFGEHRFLRAKKKLIILKLIEQVKIHKGGWYIKLNFIYKQDTTKQEPGKQGSYKNPEKQGLGKPVPNALSSNNKNALSSNKNTSPLKRTKLKRTKKAVPKFYKEFPFFKKEFTKIWFEEFIILKKKKKGSITERALKSQLKKIDKFSDGNYKTALQILEKSTNAGWTDFYKLNDNSKSFNNKSSVTIGSRRFASPNDEVETYKRGTPVYD